MTDAERTPAKVAFGELLRELRLPLKQSVFGALYGSYDRRSISAFERGVRAPQPRLLVPLREGFPHASGRIDEAVRRIDDEAKALGSLKQSGGLSSDVARIEDLIRRGRYEEATAAASRAVEETSDPSARLVELNADLAAAHGATSARTVDALYERALAITTASAPVTRESTRIREKLVDRLLDRYDYWQALEVATDRLTPLRTCADLWLRRGRSQWHLGMFPEAYASLTTALVCGASQHLVMLVRGQVLVEWGHYELGVHELTVGMRDVEGSDEHATALSVRALAFASLGNHDAAFDDLRVAKHMAPANAWVDYYRGLTYWRQGKLEEVAEAFEDVWRKGGKQLDEHQVQRMFKIVREEMLLGGIDYEVRQDLINYIFAGLPPEGWSDDFINLVTSMKAQKSPRRKRRHAVTDDA
jgi:tetratricopeptide (TPR) repeat protein